MFGLRSRKDGPKSPVADGADPSIRNGRRRTSKGLMTSVASISPMYIGVFGFVLFVVLLKATAPSTRKRFAGIDMLRNQHKNMFKEGPARQVQKVGRTGKVLHKAITSVKKEDLAGLVDELPDNIDSITYEEAIKGRERLLEILADAGVEELDVATILSLPKWTSVTKLYGDGPVVVGLETCQRFRETIPLDDASIGTAGTNEDFFWNYDFVTMNERSRTTRCCWFQPNASAFPLSQECSTQEPIPLQCTLKPIASCRITLMIRMEERGGKYLGGSTH